jgi:hypothetical protein
MLLPTFRTFRFCYPLVCRLSGNKLGPEGGTAIAEALKINTTITDIE